MRGPQERARATNKSIEIHLIITNISILSSNKAVFEDEKEKIPVPSSNKVVIEDEVVGDVAKNHYIRTL